MGDILIVDDERDIRELIADILEDEGFSARKVGTADDCMREVMTAPPNLLILDIWLKDSDMDGIDILKRVKKEYPNIPVVIISGHGNIEIAVAAIKQGAYDFIEKPFNIDQLLVVIKRAMETSRLRHENTSLRQKDRPSALMLGEAPAFKTLVLQLEKLTKTNSRVLLTGPSGCGKELAARYIHNNSERAQASFVKLLRELAQQTNGVAVVPPLKGELRARMKAQFKYRDAEGDDEYEYEAASDEEAEGADPADADDVQVRVPSEQEAMMRAILDSARESGSLGKR